MDTLIIKKEDKLEINYLKIVNIKKLVNKFKDIYKTVRRYLIIYI
jgi:hypothetical protein